MIVGEILLSILFKYDGDGSEVVDPHKKSQVIFVVMSKEGATCQRFVAKRRRKLAGTVGDLVWVQRERERGRRSMQEVLTFVVMSKGGAMRQRIVAKLREKLADVVGDLVWVQRERERGRPSTQEVAVDICVSVRVKEVWCHLGKTAGTLANLLVTTFRERGAEKQCDRRRDIVVDFV